MPNIEELPFLNAITLGADRIVINSLKDSLAQLHPDSSVLSFNKIENLEKQLKSKKHHFLIIDLQNNETKLKQFIILCKKKYRKLVIIIVGNSADIALVKDFFEIGINAFVTAEITTYEFKITLQKTFSGENYVGTGVSGKLISNFFSLQKTGLTAYELQIVKMIADGNSIEHIALSVKKNRTTIMATKKKILSKLRLHSIQDLMKYANSKNLN